MVMPVVSKDASFGTVPPAIEKSWCVVAGLEIFWAEEARARSGSAIEFGTS